MQDDMFGGFPPDEFKTKASNILTASLTARWPIGSGGPPLPVINAWKAVTKNADTFRSKFGDDELAFVKWLADNWNVWLAFHNIARPVEKHMRHWSSTGVVEVLRWKTATRDSSETFKINNNYRAGLGRLYNLVRNCSFFRTRESKADVYDQHGDPNQ